MSADAKELLTLVAIIIFGAILFLTGPSDSPTQPLSRVDSMHVELMKKELANAKTGDLIVYNDGRIAKVWRGSEGALVMDGDCCGRRMILDLKHNTQIISRMEKVVTKHDRLYSAFARMYVLQPQ